MTQEETLQQSLSETWAWVAAKEGEAEGYEGFIGRRTLNGQRGEGQKFGLRHATKYRVLRIASIVGRLIDRRASLLLIVACWDVRPAGKRGKSSTAARSRGQGDVTVSPSLIRAIVPWVEGKKRTSDSRHAKNGPTQLCADGGQHCML